MPGKTNFLGGLSGPTSLLPAVLNFMYVQPWALVSRICVANHRTNAHYADLFSYNYINLWKRSCRDSIDIVL